MAEPVPDALFGIAAQAAVCPDRVALVCGDRRVTFSELDRRVNRAARVLRARGVGDGSPVAIALRNGPEHVEVALAAARLGAAVVPASWRSTEDELEYLVEDAGVALVVAEEDARAGEVAATLHTGKEYEAELARHDGAALPDARVPEVVASRMYTSGTTGRPKAIIRAEVASRAPTDGGGFLRFWGVHDSAEVNLTSLPLHHAAGSGYAFAAVLSGQTVVLMERFDAEDLLRLIEAERVTYMNMVPTQFVRIAALAPEVRRRYDVSSLRRVMHGSAPCPIDAKQAMFDLFGPIIWETYGGTEGLATVASPDEWLARPGTVGRAVAAMGTDVVILDERGEPLPAGEAGLVYVSTPPHATAAAWRGSWFTLGDVGYLDADGFLFLVDRSKDMIITGGENVYPAETERVLAAHPAVSQAAVIGVPDPEWGESVLAVVVASAPVTGDELIEYCRARLASHKCPRAVDLVTELPLDPLGKVRKRELRNRYLS